MKSVIPVIGFAVLSGAGKTTLVYQLIPHFLEKQKIYKFS
jgi:molybdopterin-guanine dinucleotide biosynthesis protein